MYSVCLLWNLLFVELSETSMPLYPLNCDKAQPETCKEHVKRHLMGSFHMSSCLFYSFIHVVWTHSAATLFLVIVVPCQIFIHFFWGWERGKEFYFYSFFLNFFWGGVQKSTLTLCSWTLGAMWFNFDKIVP